MQLTCLTYEQLSSYTDNTINLSEKESLYKHISQCELCSCAVNGFAAMPFTENELVAINQIVDVKSNASASNSLTLAQVFIATLSIASIFGVYFISNAIHSPVEKPILTTETKWEQPLEIAIPTKEVVKKENKLIKTVSAIPKKQLQNNSASLELIPTITTKEITGLNESTKETIVPISNSSIIYIYDLKVSDYNNLYFGRSNKKIIYTGTPVFKEHSKSNSSELDEDNLESIAANQVLKKGLAAFNKGEFVMALGDFNTLLTLNKEDVNALFYAGLSHYNNGNYIKAADYFNKTTKNKNNAFYQEAQWYLAQSYDKTGDKEKANELYVLITKENGFYKDKAKEKIK
ncbi:MAG: tetratricopeptide repeat protein [Bacteroidetes bacterium]|nr:tetratricopeptide repeat protein [Bacteroidota bacterium]